MAVYALRSRQAQAKDFMAQHGSTSLTGRPVIFGEVLYDSFPDADVLGGAPFNVAWHLQGFGLQPLFISRVGQDSLGDQVLDTMQGWGMDTAGIQRHAERPTGMVKITFTGSQHSFDILPDQAYDFIDAEAAAASLAEQPCALLYHGSLIQRHAVSRGALEGLCERMRLPLFIDINLRTPWWEHAAVDSTLHTARWAKLNDEELDEVLRTQVPREKIAQRAQDLCADFGMELLVLTLGADGAFFITPDEVLRGAPHPVEHMMDTVGAGDAFASVTLLGLLRGWAPQHTLERALEFAARICAQRGATSPDASLYGHYLEKWSNDD